MIACARPGVNSQCSVYGAKLEMMGDVRIQIDRPLVLGRTWGFQCSRKMLAHVAYLWLGRHKKRHWQLLTAEVLKTGLPSRQVPHWKWSLCYECRRWPIAGYQPTALCGIEGQPESSRGRKIFVM